MRAAAVTKYSRADALRQQHWWREKKKNSTRNRSSVPSTPNIRRHPRSARGRESSPLLETIYSHGLARNLLPQLLLVATPPTELVTRITRIIEWEPTVAARNRISRDICCAASYLARWSSNSRMWHKVRGLRDEGWNLFNSSPLALFGTLDPRAWAPYYIRASLLDRRSHCRLTAELDENKEWIVILEY